MQTGTFLNKNPYFSLLYISWQYTPSKARYLFIYFLFMCSNVVMATYPFIWGMYINDIQMNGAGIWRSSVLYGGAYLVVRLADWGFHFPARIMEREMAFHISRNFLGEMYHKTLHLPVSWHQDNHSGETINRVRKAYEALKDFFQSGFEYLQAFFKFVFSFGAMIYFAPVFGVVAAVLGVFVVWIILIFDKTYIRTRNEMNEREGVVTSTLFDSLSNIITVITLRLEKRMEKGLLRKVADILPPFKKNVSVNEWKWFVTDMLVGVVYVVILLGYVWQNYVPGQVFQLGGLVMLVGFVERFTSVFHSVAYLYTDVVRHHTDVTMAQKILVAYEEQHLPETPRTLPANWQQLDIKGLHFSHHSFADWAKNKPDAQTDFYFAGLKDIQLRLERGKRIALIGESGSGKSTILALLRGLYPPEKGVTLTLNQTQPEDWDVLAGSVTLFPQEPEIFENTLEYNITLGLPFEPDELAQICKTVHFQDVIDQLPNGLQSNIVEKGVNLSGGQKQRLALARGVFAAKDSPIILMDEPTSSVDPKTEAKIYDGLFEAFADKVIVSSLHRLHLLHKFDYIYILEKGRVKDEGTLSELLQKSETFQALWAHQEQSGEGNDEV